MRRIHFYVALVAGFWPQASAAAVIQTYFPVIDVQFLEQYVTRAAGSVTLNTNTNATTLTSRFYSQSTLGSGSSATNSFALYFDISDVDFSRLGSARLEWTEVADQIGQTINRHELQATFSSSISIPASGSSTSIRSYPRVQFQVANGVVDAVSIDVTALLMGTSAPINQYVLFQVFPRDFTTSRGRLGSSSSVRTYSIKGRLAGPSEGPRLVISTVPESSPATLLAFASIGGLVIFLRRQRRSRRAAD